MISTCCCACRLSCFFASAAARAFATIASCSFTFCRSASNLPSSLLFKKRKEIVRVNPNCNSPTEGAPHYMFKSGLPCLSFVCINPAPSLSAALRL